MSLIVRAIRNTPASFQRNALFSTSTGKWAELIKRIFSQEPQKTSRVVFISPKQKEKAIDQYYLDRFKKVLTKNQK